MCVNWKYAKWEPVSIISTINWIFYVSRKKKKNNVKKLSQLGTLKLRIKKKLKLVDTLNVCY